MIFLVLVYPLQKFEKSKVAYYRSSLKYVNTDYSKIFGVKLRRFKVKRINSYRELSLAF